MRSHLSRVVGNTGYFLWPARLLTSIALWNFNSYVIYFDKLTNESCVKYTLQMLIIALLLIPFR